MVDRGLGRQATTVTFVTVWILVNHNNIETESGSKELSLPSNRKG